MDQLIPRTRGTTIPGIVEKCLSSARAGTKAKAIEALLFYVEVDVPDPVLVHLRNTHVAYSLGRFDSWTIGQITKVSRCHNHCYERNISPIWHQNCQS